MIKFGIAINIIGILYCLAPLIIQAIILILSGGDGSMTSVSLDGGKTNYFIGQEFDFKQHYGLIFLSIVLFVNVYLLMKKQKDKA